MKLSEFVKTHELKIDYITFYEDAINLYLKDRLQEIYSGKNRRLSRLLRKFLKKYSKRRIVFLPTDLEGAPPFIVKLGKDNYEFQYDYDDIKEGDIVVKTDHVTMTSVGLGSITILRSLIEERLDFYPYYPIMEKIRLAKLFGLRIIF